MAGLAFGGISVGMMLPIEFPDKPAALLGAFLNRFGVGLVIGCVRLSWPGWAVKLGAIEDLNAELKGWLKAAYDLSE